MFYFLSGVVETQCLILRDTKTFHTAFTMLPSTLREKDAQWSHYSMDWSVLSNSIGTAVLLYESGTAYVICCMHVLYEKVQYFMLIKASDVLHCYVC